MQHIQSFYFIKFRSSNFTQTYVSLIKQSLVTDTLANKRHQTFSVYQKFSSIITEVEKLKIAKMAESMDYTDDHTGEVTLVKYNNPVLVIKNPEKPLDTIATIKVRCRCIKWS